VALAAGGEVRATEEALRGRSGRVAVGVRPEKLRLGGEAANRIDGRVSEVAYVGVATQYVIETAAGAVSAYVQNTERGATGPAPGAAVTLSFSPEAVFVVPLSDGLATTEEGTEA